MFRPVLLHIVCLGSIHVTDDTSLMAIKDLLHRAVCDEVDDTRLICYSKSNLKCRLVIVTVMGLSRALLCLTGLDIHTVAIKDDKVHSAEVCRSLSHGLCVWISRNKSGERDCCLVSHFNSLHRLHLLLSQFWFLAREQHYRRCQKYIYNILSHI